MSKSRLEKFLYALYSLDTSDLPNPLSRIEELYKCLVTGEEAPTFEPISRVEKYLMAILGGYEADSLPNPLSRMEVLLYKLATGDDNLDDIESFLSEHEELLAEIIRNGGVGGNIDIEYILYTLSTEFNTLYNTAEKPVKSAILKGQTLVNIKGNQVTIGAVGRWCEYLIPTVKPNTRYLITYDLESTASKVVIGFLKKISTWSNNLENQGLKGQFILNSGDEPNYFRIGGLPDTVTTVKGLNIIEYQEGMENWDIPFFEGMQSVKMPVLTTVGKNLFNMNKTIDAYLNVAGEIVTPVDAYNKLSDYIEIKPNTTYVYSHGGFIIPDDSELKELWTRYYIYDENKTKLTYGTQKTESFSLTTPTNAKYIRIGSRFIGLEGAYAQIEEGSTATTYEPYKSNILTVNEDVTLRGIGDVKDELDLLTGELTQRIGEVVLDGNAGWSEYNGNYYVSAPGVQAAEKFPWGKATILSNLYPSFIGEETDVYIESGWNGNQIKIHDVNLSLEELKSKLMTQPLVATYISNEESVKTVDLSVVDQDGNNTKLSTFDDLTHVTLSSEGLIPEAELEVATKNEEDLEDSSVYTTHTLSEEFNTLYNTAEKPVKSAILKGDTLVNVNNGFSSSWGGVIISKSEVSSIGRNMTQWTFDKSLLKSNTTYLLKFDCLATPTINRVKGFAIYADNGVSGYADFSNGPISIIATSGDLSISTNNLKFGIQLAQGEECDVALSNIMLIEYQEGMENWDIPYFEGMQSVKMPVLTTTGKNLFDGKLENGAIVSSTGVDIPSTDNVRSIGYIKVNANASIVISNDLNYSNSTIYEYDANKKYIGRKYTNPFTTSENCHYIRFRSDANQPNLNVKYQIEYSTKATSYEPFKSNILTVNEEVELHEIGDIKDELNLLTGEVVKRVGKVVLDGSIDEAWTTITNSNAPAAYVEGYASAYINLSDFRVGTSVKLINDRGLPRLSSVGSNSEGLFYLNNYIGNRALILRIDKSKVTNSLREYLQHNPITIQYQLATESVKTVDLSVVDQDGKNTKLSTFDDLTHVTLSSEGLIPEAKLEVAEKVPEVAANMFTISREQEVINTTINEQSENVDATMIATTEIYEELL